MNKKGFTLVELLAVIGLLSIIVVIAVPSVNNLRKNSLDQEEKNQIKSIESAAVFYAQDENKKNCCVSIQELLTSNYLTGDSEGKLINPKTNQEMNGNVFIDSTGKKATYGYTDACVNCE